MKSNFLKACKSGDEEDFAAGLLAGLAQSAVGRVGGRGPLHCAAEGGRFDLVARLIRAGADVNMRDDFALSPLMTACQRGCEKSACVLIESGAVVDCLSAIGASPMAYAVVGPNSGILKLLLDSGADPDYALEKGKTPLAEAARIGNRICFDTLLAAGADLEGGAAPKGASRNKLGKWSPLWAAVTSGEVEMTRELLARGAKVDLRGKEDRTPVMSALAEGRENIVSALIAAGARMDLKDEDQRGWTHFAARCGDPRAMEELVRFELARREGAEIAKAAGMGSGSAPGPKPRL